MPPWILRRRSLPLTTGVIVAALAALAFVAHGSWADAVLTVIGWAAALLAFLLLGTGWMRAGAAAVAISVTAVALALLVG
jgi:hypothetical protein